MPLGDIAAGLLEGTWRFIVEIFLQVVLELLLKGPGYLILRYVFLRDDKDIDPDGVLVVFLGVLFWLILSCIGYFTYRYLSSN